MATTPGTGHNVGGGDDVVVAFAKRRINLETERQAVADAIKDLGVEMADKKLSKVDRDAIALLVKRHFEEEAKKAHREEVEERWKQIEMLL
jgi:Arc/MetJ family transcription regulator